MYRFANRHTHAPSSFYISLFSLLILGFLVEKKNVTQKIVKTCAEFE